MNSQRNEKSQLNPKIFASENMLSIENDRKKTNGGFVRRLNFTMCCEIFKMTASSHRDPYPSDL